MYSDSSKFVYYWHTTVIKELYLFAFKMDTNTTEDVITEIEKENEYYSPNRGFKDSDGYGVQLLKYSTVCQNTHETSLNENDDNVNTLVCQMQILNLGSSALMHKKKFDINAWSSPLKSIENIQHVDVDTDSSEEIWTTPPNNSGESCIKENQEVERMKSCGKKLSFITEKVSSGAVNSEDQPFNEIENFKISKNNYDFCLDKLHIDGITLLNDEITVNKSEGTNVDFSGKNNDFACISTSSLETDKTFQETAQCSLEEKEIYTVINCSAQTTSEENSASEMSHSCTEVIHSDIYYPTVAEFPNSYCEIHPETTVDSEENENLFSEVSENAQRAHDSNSNFSLCGKFSSTSETNNTELKEYVICSECAPMGREINTEVENISSQIVEPIKIKFQTDVEHKEIDVECPETVSCFWDIDEKMTGDDVLEFFLNYERGKENKVSVVSELDNNDIKQKLTEFSDLDLWYNSQENTVINVSYKDENILKSTYDELNQQSKILSETKRTSIEQFPEKNVSLPDQEPLMQSYVFQEKKLDFSENNNTINEIVQVSDKSEENINDRDSTSINSSDVLKDEAIHEYSLREEIIISESPKKMLQSPVEKEISLCEMLFHANENCFTPRNNAERASNEDESSINSEIYSPEKSEKNVSPIIEEFRDSNQMTEFNLSENQESYVLEKETYVCDKLSEINISKINADEGIPWLSNPDEKIIENSLFEITEKKCKIESKTAFLQMETTSLCSNKEKEIDFCENEAENKRTGLSLKNTDIYLDENDEFVVSCGENSDDRIIEFHSNEKTCLSTENEKSQWLAPKPTESRENFENFSVSPSDGILYQMIDSFNGKNEVNQFFNDCDIIINNSGEIFKQNKEDQTSNITISNDEIVASIKEDTLFFGKEVMLPENLDNNDKLELNTKLSLQSKLSLNKSDTEFLILSEEIDLSKRTSTSVSAYECIISEKEINVHLEVPEKCEKYFDEIVFPKFEVLSINNDLQIVQNNKDEKESDKSSKSNYEISDDNLTSNKEKCTEKSEEMCTLSNEEIDDNLNFNENLKRQSISAFFVNEEISTSKSCKKKLPLVNTAEFSLIEKLPSNEKHFGESVCETEEKLEHFQKEFLENDSLNEITKQERNYDMVQIQECVQNVIETEDRLKLSSNENKVLENSFINFKNTDNHKTHEKIQSPYIDVKFELPENTFSTFAKLDESTPFKSNQCHQQDLLLRSAKVAKIRENFSKLLTPFRDNLIHVCAPHVDSSGVIETINSNQISPNKYDNSDGNQKAKIIFEFSTNLLDLSINALENMTAMNPSGFTVQNAEERTMEIALDHRTTDCNDELVELDKTEDCSLLVENINLKKELEEITRKYKELETKFDTATSIAQILHLNECSLKETVLDLENNLRKSENKYQLLKEYANNFVVLLNVTLEEKDEEIEKLKKEIHIVSTQKK